MDGDNCILLTLQEQMFDDDDDSDGDRLKEEAKDPYLAFPKG